jgi:hypothetical protein
MEQSYLTGDLEGSAVDLEDSPSRLAQQEQEIADRAALLNSKVYAVATRDDPYAYEQIEEDFIQFLLEKVVMLRELPYMRAALNVERDQNLQKLN